MISDVSLLLLASAALAQGQPAVSDTPSLDPVLAVQIMLDRERHSPGVIDGKDGGNTRRAVAAFEEANGLAVDGKIDPEVVRLLRERHDGSPLLVDHVIAPADVVNLVKVPKGMVEQAELDHLGYETAREALAEKFHMDQRLLERLNPGVDFAAAGTKIRVAKPGDREIGAKVARIEVRKSPAELRAFAADGKLLASYPATIGSETFPSPSGTMEVRTVASKPTYYFNPEGRSWGPDKRLTIAAGPNNPVGSTWIDLTKEGYGIHGTPEPRLIGKTPSHGCVRLTNWDAEELSGAVSAGTVVTFVG